MAGNELCEKTYSLTFAGCNLAQSSTIVKPAAEKTISDGADVAAIAKIHAVNSDSNGKHFLFVLHHSNGLLNSLASS